MSCLIPPIAIGNSMYVRKLKIIIWISQKPNRRKTQETFPLLLPSAPSFNIIGLCFLRSISIKTGEPKNNTRFLAQKLGRIAGNHLQWCQAIQGYWKAIARCSSPHMPHSVNELVMKQYSDSPDFVIPKCTQ
jgi:hypothetical protein